jgi:hypothetical protein
VSSFAGIHDLAYCFSRVGGSVDSGVRQDWVGLGANIGALAGKAVWYSKGQSAALKAALEAGGKKILPTPTAIIDVTMVAVVVVDLLNGFGAPDSGVGFASGVDKLKNVDSKLELSIPDSRDWSGNSADAYTEANAALRALVTQMQELDRAMQKIVAGQSAEIKQAHQTMAILGFALVASQGVALLMYMIPLVGPEVSFLFQVAAALAATTTVIVQETLVLARSLNAATAAEKVAADYVALGKRAELGGTFATISVTGAQETRYSSFKEISDSMSAFTKAPTVAQVVNAAGSNVSEERRALLNAFTTDEPPTNATPDTPETPEVPDVPADDVTPATPAFTMPTMAQVSQMTGQMAKITNDLSQPMNVANQAATSIQQMVSSAQQGAQQGESAEAAPVDAPVAEPPAAATEDYRINPDDMGLGAGSGAEAGERAPVDIAATEDALEQDRPRRVL